MRPSALVDERISELNPHRPECLPGGRKYSIEIGRVKSSRCPGRCYRGLELAADRGLCDVHHNAKVFLGLRFLFYHHAFATGPIGIRVLCPGLLGRKNELCYTPETADGPGGKCCASARISGSCPMTPLSTLSGMETLEAFTDALVARMKGVVPEAEVRLKAPIAWEILRLKKEVNAIILGHNYMEPVLYHSVPDYTGDSLQLSAVAAGTDADVIIFCGVWFMGETAKVLNPGKIVLVPSTKAGCSLAEGITAEDVLRLREQFPGAPVVSYVNTYATVKAVSDYCCTSGNADKVVKHLLDAGYREIIFVPDRYLAENTARQVGARFWMAGGDEQHPPADDGPLVIGWSARCEVHELFTPQDVENVRRQYPDAVILAHPECSPEVIAKVDIAGSTKLMVDYVRDASTRRIALFTECAMGDNLAAEFPEKELVRSCALRCRHMNTITLEDTLHSLQTLTPRVELDPDIIMQARRPIDRMLAIR